MASVIGNCVKTGASVLIEDYGIVAYGDIFAQGDQLICNFSGRFNDMPFDPSIYHTHRMRIGQQGFLHKEKFIAVVPRSNLIGELIE